jgi:hypothetical protein
MSCVNTLSVGRLVAIFEKLGLVIKLIHVLRFGSVFRLDGIEYENYK